MYDSFDRRIDYLRISITDKCNLRCVYCMPEEGVPRRSHEDFLSFEAITKIVRSAVSLGVTKVRLTGGEPLVKRDVVGLVRMLKEVPGLETLAMTTNGTLLPRYADELRHAGLDRLNISLDTLDPERYRSITRGGEIGRVLEGIDAALGAGFPVKINMVVMEDTGRGEIAGLRRFCESRGMTLQRIRHFSLTAEKNDDHRFDRPLPCAECNRIRLLAGGVLKPCLHSDDEIPVDPADIAGSLRRAVERKPARGAGCTVRDMQEIGG